MLLSHATVVGSISAYIKDRLAAIHGGTAIVLSGGDRSDESGQ